MEELFKMLASVLQDPNNGLNLPTEVGDAATQVANYFGQDDRARAMNKLNVDVQRDINPYTVNPSRGFFNFEGGGSIAMSDMDILLNRMPYRSPGAGILPSLPTDAVQGLSLVPEFEGGGWTSDMFDGLYNLGTKRGRRKQRQLERIINRANKGNENALAKLEGLQNQAILNNLENQGYDVNLINKRNQVYEAINPQTGETQQYDVDTRLGFGNRVWNSGKGGFDIMLSNLGMPDVIQNSFVDRSKFLSGLTATIGSIAPALLNVALPELGTAVSMGANAINSNFVNPAMGNTLDNYAGSTSLPFNLPTSADQLYTPNGSMFDILTGGGIGGAITQPAQFSNLFGTPTPTGNPTGNTGIGGVLGMYGLGNGGRVGNYEEGGVIQRTPLVPIQTEVGEMIIHSDLTLTEVNATKKHKHMDPDLVTDIAPEGAYIASDSRDMRIHRDEAEEITIGIKALPYSEMIKQPEPERTSLDVLFGKNKKMTPAEMVRALKRKYPTKDVEEELGYNDIFTTTTNKENIMARLPYVTAIIGLNEEKRSPQEEEMDVQTFGQGGAVRMGGIPHADGGMDLGSILALAGQAAPIFTQLFGGNKKDGYQALPGQIGPLEQSLMLSSIPLGYAGQTANINAQRGALNQGISDYGQLSSQLQQYANQSAQSQQAANAFGAVSNIMGQLGQDLDPTTYDFNPMRTRLNNARLAGNTNAVRDFQSTPMVDIQELARTLGPGGADVINQQLAETRRNASQAAANQLQREDQFNMEVINQLNNIGMNEQQLNNPLLNQAREQRNQQLANVSGLISGAGQRAADIQSGLAGRMGDILSELLPIVTGMNMQHASLEGQNLINAGQANMDVGATLAALKNQNRAMAWGHNQQQPQGPMDALTELFKREIPGINEEVKRRNIEETSAEMDRYLQGQIFGPSGAASMIPGIGANPGTAVGTLPTLPNIPTYGAPAPTFVPGIGLITLPNIPGG